MTHISNKEKLLEFTIKKESYSHYFDIKFFAHETEHRVTQVAPGDTLDAVISLNNGTLLKKEDQYIQLFDKDDNKLTHKMKLSPSKIDETTAKFSFVFPNIDHKGNIKVVVYLTIKEGEEIKHITNHTNPGFIQVGHPLHSDVQGILKTRSKLNLAKDFKESFKHITETDKDFRKIKDIVSAIKDIIKKEEGSLGGIKSEQDNFQNLAWHTEERKNNFEELHNNIEELRQVNLKLHKWLSLLSNSKIFEGNDAYSQSVYDALSKCSELDQNMLFFEDLFSIYRKNPSKEDVISHLSKIQEKYAIELSPSAIQKQKESFSKQYQMFGVKIGRILINLDHILDFRKSLGTAAKELEEIYPKIQEWSAKHEAFMKIKHEYLENAPPGTTWLKLASQNEILKKEIESLDFPTEEEVKGKETKLDNIQKKLSDDESFQPETLNIFKKDIALLKQKIVDLRSIIAKLKR